MINWYCPQGDTNNTYLMRYDERGDKAMYRRTLEQMLAMASSYDEKASIIAEEYGLEYKLQGNKMIYYSYFGKIDGIYKIIINLDTGEQTRKRLAYEKTPKHLKGRVNYYVG